MKARIITIGDEILIGQIVDTNSAFIAARLNETGITVDSRISVGDNRDDMRRAIEEGLAECNLVITTGGIGPTRDDITKEVVAGIFGCELTLHQPSFEHIERLLAARGVAFNSLNRSQAMIPSCATVLTNDNGTAPGLWLERGGSILVVLPGVPFEMEALMTNRVLPRLTALVPGQAIIHRTMITTGIPESVLAERIAAWEDALPSYIKLAYLPSPAGVRLRLSAYGVDREKVGPEIDRAFAMLEPQLAGHVAGYGEASPESYIAALLKARNLTLAVAESCTGGAIAARFTAMPGASNYFLAGVVSYSNQAKAQILGVNPADIEAHGAVSETVARQMAEGIRRITGAHYAIATTGIAGPTGGTPEKPVGTVWIAIATPTTTTTSLHNFGNLRTPNIQRTTTTAINLLRQVIEGV